MNAVDDNKRQIAEAALEKFRDRQYAFTPVPKRGRFWQLGIAIKDERGYHPLDGIEWANREDAQRWANDLNSHIGLSNETVQSIILSTMKKTRR